MKDYDGLCIIFVHSVNNFSHKLGDEADVAHAQENDEFLWKQLNYRQFDRITVKYC